MKSKMNDIPVGYNKVVDKKRLYFIAGALEQSIPPNGKVLDIGCGNGHISIYIGGLGYEVEGIDISEKAIEKAKLNNKYSNVSFAVQDAEKLVAQNKKYDAIICSEVLEHLHQPSGLLSCVYQLLKPEGIVIITVPNGYGPRELTITRPMQYIMKKEGVLKSLVTGLKSLLGYNGTTIQSDADELGHVQFFTKKKLSATVEKQGFKLEVFAKADFVTDVFPFSFFIRRSVPLQKMDVKFADKLPFFMTSGFYCIGRKGVLRP